MPLRSLLMWVGIALILYILGMAAYALIYWLLSMLSGEYLYYQQVAAHLRSTLTGSAALIPVFTALVGWGIEWWRYQLEGAKNREIQRRKEALGKLEQLSETLRKRLYSKALALYRVFQERCESGIWRGLGLEENLRRLWKEEAPRPLQVWVDLSDGVHMPKVESEDLLYDLEALIWGAGLEPREWEVKGKSILNQVMTPENLGRLVELFRRHETWRTLLRTEVVRPKLAELGEAVTEEQWESLQTFQGWQALPLQMPHPWEGAVRPPGPSELVEGLKQIGFHQNPFGPLLAEQDPLLADYGIWPSSLEDARGPQPALVFGPSGAGRTAAALLLFWKCLHPPGNPEEAGAFPVWLKTDSWPETEEGWLHIIGQALTEALLQVGRNDPFGLFADRETAPAIAFSLSHYLGPAESRVSRLRLAGFSDSRMEYVLWKIEDYLEIPLEGKPDVITLYDLIGNARPPTRHTTYILVDVSTFPPSVRTRRIQSLQLLAEMAGPLSIRNTYLKLFMPEDLGNSLQPYWPLEPLLLQWSEEELRVMLGRRLSVASNGYVESLDSICSAQKYPPDPDTWLVRSAQGAPRRLVELGNQMLREACQ